MSQLKCNKVTKWEIYNLILLLSAYQPTQMCSPSSQAKGTSPSSQAKGTKSTSFLHVRNEVDLVPLACEDDVQSNQII